MPFNKVNNAHLDLKWVYYNFTEKRYIMSVFYLQYSVYNLLQKNTSNMKYKILNMLCSI